jgi:predicted RNA-binding protein YlxR (DUF448 family)
MLKALEMSKKRHVPIRTCIGCRRKKKKGGMLRFAQTIDGVMVADEKKRMNGRGFYLCPDLICFKMAQKKERWGRFFRIDGLPVSFQERFEIREERE